MPEPETDTIHIELPGATGAEILVRLALFALSLIIGLCCFVLVMAVLLWMVNSGYSPANSNWFKLPLLGLLTFLAVVVLALRDGYSKRGLSAWTIHLCPRRSLRLEQIGTPDPKIRYCGSLWGLRRFSRCIPVADIALVTWHRQRPPEDSPVDRGKWKVVIGVRDDGLPIQTDVARGLHQDEAHRLGATIIEALATAGLHLEREDMRAWLEHVAEQGYPVNPALGDGGAWYENRDHWDEQEPNQR